MRLLEARLLVLGGRKKERDEFLDSFTSSSRRGVHWLLCVCLGVMKRGWRAMGR